MRPDTKRMDDPRADEPATVVAGNNRSQESRKALHPPTSARGQFDAISAQRPGCGLRVSLQRATAATRGAG